MILVANELKLLYPHAVIVIGGFHSTNATRALLQYDSIDYVFRGESENSLVEF